MTPDKWKALFITVIAVVAVSIGETLLTKGMKETGDGTWREQLFAAVTNRWVGIGMLLMALYFGLYMAALKMAPLSFVLPITALSFLIGGVLAKFVLHEDVNLTKWIGYFIIMAGVVVVGFGESSGK